MGKHTSPAIKITLDKERNLLLDLNAMASFEEMTGKNLLAGIDLTSMNIGDFRALLWACLIHEDENLTLKQLGAMIHPGNLPNVSSAIEQAFMAAVPEARDDDTPLVENRQVG